MGKSLALIVLGSFFGGWAGGCLYDVYHPPLVNEPVHGGGITVRQLLERERVGVATPPL